MSNLELWEKVEKTPHDQTKPITGKAYKGNSPKPHYIVWKATETFGPAGIGWGFEIIEEKLLDGALLEPGFYERIHMARVRVWYEWAGKRGTVEHVGQTVFCGKRANGAKFSDEDAPKKSVTDGLIKALSLIGFAGDIFLGRYDDSKYVAELMEEGRQRPDPVEDQRRSNPPVSDDDGRIGSKERYLKQCRIRIASGQDYRDLAQWWKDEAKARRDFDLSQEEVNELKDLIVAKSTGEAA